ncbi:hypothetical protein V6K52_19855 [Knoellia sp. S7-12]|uniref:hypothetical protein n=1 Tax=Knoellia sp. S7-12 TaxID=3126698 RepID=UPI003367329B
MNTHDDDTDPTGMRALLRGLPDPGPMPDDLVDRIRASLADLPPLEGSGVDSAEGHQSATGVVSRETTHPAATRASWWARHGSHVAVAAVVLVGGGVVASIPFGELGSVSNTEGAASAGSDTAGDQSKSFTESDAEPAAPQNTPDLNDADGGRQAVLGAIAVRLSGRAYTAADLASQLGPVYASGAGPTTTPLTAEAPGIGPIGTEIGVRSCLEALGLPRATRADVDLSTLDGTPAAVLVVTLEGERTAYAVGRDCTTDNPALLAGPVALP